jgi:NAD(P)H-flavin reductase
MTPQPARVVRAKRETQDTFTLDVAPVDGPLPGFDPGQFSMLYVFGVAELPISISGDPDREGGLTYTVRSVGPATQALISRTENDCVGIRGPFGNAWPLESARGKDIVIVAGGIGLAPIRPAIYRIMHRRQEYGRLIILYGARSPGDVLYRKQLAQWGHHLNTQVLVTVDYGGLHWRGNVGVVTTLFRHVRLNPERTVVFVCGPEIMIRYVAMELNQRGVAGPDIYVSMERNMKCGIGLCGHCQFGPLFVCRDGPVYPYSRVAGWMAKYEV